ncbi:MAG: VanZ family protein [Romboutsia sp.]|uniref:VanZ family protein n=1 Tax=Romboutsia sp. TaxID=1965302 RepID=UPI003F3A3E10
MKRRKIISLFLLVGWMIFIFYMSNQPANVSSTQSNFVLKLVEKLGFVIDIEYVDIATTVIRKGAHITEYTILGILSYNVFILYYSRREAMIIAIALTIGYAITDEIHQLFVEGRAGRIIDILIDSIGASIGVTIGFAYNRIRLNRVLKEVII